jgi:hypothetical protein
MRQFLVKIRPVEGFAKIAHILLTLLIPIGVLILVRLNFYQLAFSLVLLSKWRMVSVKPRFWAANIRANSIDILVGLSIVSFMIRTSNISIQLFWGLMYALWMIYLKPGSTLRLVSIQAFTGMALSLSAVYMSWGGSSLFRLTLVSGFICFFAARHFFDAFDEPYSRLLSYTWGYFGAAISWLLAHLLIYYGFLAMPALLIGSLGYGLGTLYYLDHKSKVTKIIKQQIVFIMIALVVLVVTFSRWGDRFI